MTRTSLFCFGAILIFFLSACSAATVTPETTTESVPPSATLEPIANVSPTALQTPTPFINAATALAGTRPPHTPVTPTRTRTPAATRPPGAAPLNASGKPEPTVLKNAKQIPETHQGRTQCLTCHEFGNVGPPMPQFHKDDHYTDNTFCKRCHTEP